MAVWQNIIIQLGISALIVFAVFKIAMLLINKWAERDAARTKTIEDGFRAITDAHADVLKQTNDNHLALVSQQHANHATVMRIMNEHQQQELELIAKFRIDLNRLDSKMSTALDLTPVGGTPRIDPNVIVDKSIDEPTTPVDRPPVKPRAQSVPGIPRAVTEYGPFQGRPSKKG